MNDRWKLLLLFQVLPLTLVILNVLFLVLSVTHSYNAYGYLTNPNMTNWERDPQWVMSEFWNGMAFAGFFFFAGMPFEAMLLYFDSVDRRREVIESIRKRKTRV